MQEWHRSGCQAVAQCVRFGVECRPCAAGDYRCNLSQL